MKIFPNLIRNLPILNRFHSVAQPRKEVGGRAKRRRFQCVNHPAIFRCLVETAAPATAQLVTPHAFGRFHVHLRLLIASAISPHNRYKSPLDLQIPCR